MYSNAHLAYLVHLHLKKEIHNRNNILKNQYKGNPTIADLRYGGKDIISTITLIVTPLKS